MWKAILIRYLILVLSLAVTVWLVPGISVQGEAVPTVLLMGLFLGAINVIVKPILKFFSCGCIVVTLGLFLLVINAFALWFASWLAQLVGIGFVVDSFWAAFWGGLIISIVSLLLNMLIPDEI